jgi:hypothetical protein
MKNCQTNTQTRARETCHHTYAPGDARTRRPCRANNHPFSGCEKLQHQSCRTYHLPKSNCDNEDVRPSVSRRCTVGAVRLQLATGYLRRRSLTHTFPTTDPLLELSRFSAANLSSGMQSTMRAVMHGCTSDRAGSYGIRCRTPAASFTAIPHENTLCFRNLFSMRRQAV